VAVVVGIQWTWGFQRQVAGLEGPAVDARSANLRPDRWSGARTRADGHGEIQVIPGRRRTRNPKSAVGANVQVIRRRTDLERREGAQAIDPGDHLIELGAHIRADYQVGDGVNGGH